MYTIAKVFDSLMLFCNSYNNATDSSLALNRVFTPSTELLSFFLFVAHHIFR